MEDKDLMEKELLITKGLCDLYLHGSLEATTAEVHEAFKCSLNECINIQNKLYNLMSEKGWYKTDVAPQNQIDTVKQKFANK